MDNVLFLYLLALLWTLFATAQDLKKRIISNWVVVSLIIFAMGFRFFYSAFELEEFNFFYQGVFGLAVFFIVGNLFYYSRFFAGGDAKMMVALGTILPLSIGFVSNLNIFVYFLLTFLFIGGFYGLVWSLVLAFFGKNFSNYKKEFGNQFTKNKFSVLTASMLGIFLIFLYRIDFFISYLGIMVLLFPFLYLHAKAVDETSLVKTIKPLELEEGDWLYKDLHLGRKKIISRWGGLTKKEIAEIRKRVKKVRIRYGIPFAPVFFISLLVWIYFIVSKSYISFVF